MENITPDVFPADYRDPKDAEGMTKGERKEAAKRPWGLTDRQSSFLNEYLVDFNCNRAARLLGIPIETAKMWMKRTDINNAIDAQLEKRRKENEDLVRMTLEELKTVMCSDIRDFVKWNSRNVVLLVSSKDLKNSKAIKGIEKTKHGVRLTLHDKVRAIEHMMQGLGMMRKPKEELLPQPGDKGSELEMSLLEALTRAHEDRKALPATTGGTVEIQSETENVKKEEEDGGQGAGSQS